MERVGTLKTTLTVGRLTCPQVRSQFEKAKLFGLDLEWVESKGWLESDFHIVLRGSESQLHSFAKTLKEWTEAS
jgi:hypothetical protein